MMNKKILFSFLVTFFLLTTKSDCQFFITPYIGLDRINFQNLPLQPAGTIKFHFLFGLNLEKKIGKKIGLEYGLMYSESNHKFSNGDSPGSQDFRLSQNFIHNNVSLKYSIFEKLFLGGGLNLRNSVSSERENLNTGIIDSNIENSRSLGLLTYLELDQYKFSLRIYNIFRIDNNEMEGREPVSYYGLTLGYNISIGSR